MFALIDCNNFFVSCERTIGAPLFKFKKIIKTHAIQCLSPKFELYHYKSQQVIRTVSSLIPEYEIYSIDEIFFQLKGI